MKLGLIIFGLFFTFSVQALDVGFFEKYPSVKTVDSCKYPDFNSYHRTQAAKSALVRDNPDLSKPNYAGKYLLLKHELLMETVWYIADCETGKFSRETLKGIVEFKPNSMLAIVSKPKSTDPVKYQVWSGAEWSQVSLQTDADPAANTVDKPKVVATASIAPVTGAFDEQYKKVFETYPVTESTQQCKQIDYNSFFRAQRGKDNIIEINPDRARPNFAGHYLLLKNELMFETLWYLVDCRTGKFSSQYLKGNLVFRLDSSLILTKTSSEYPTLSIFRDDLFVPVLDPIRTGKQVVENKLYDTDATLLRKVLGAERDSSKITFENLSCENQSCSIQIYPGKEARTLSPDLTSVAQALLKKWGSQQKDTWSIEEGVCRLEQAKPVCEIILRR